MKALGIEFSSHQRGVGIAATDASGRAVTLAEAVETGGRAAHTFRMVDAALAQAGLEREQIECVAVGLGPGSYTGIRAAISCAQGWQLALGVRLLGVGTVECIAAEASSQGICGRVAVVVDAQRGEFYVAEYEARAGEALRPATPLRIVTHQKTLRLEADGALLIGPEAPRDAQRFRVVPPRAAVLARLAVERDDFAIGEDLAPIYLRETTFVKATQK
jgi:tRNA threonylcarbamoyl adenosine modification protein YeaZ